MPKLFSLKKPSREKIKELVKKLHEYPELKPRMTIIWPLSQERKQALEMIKTEKINEGAVLNLLKSGDFVKRRAGLYILSSTETQKTTEVFQKKILSILEKLTQDKDQWIKEKAIKSLSQLGSQALPILRELIEGDKYKEWRLKVTSNQTNAIKALGQIGSTAVPYLKELTQNEKWWIKEASMNTLRKMVHEKLVPRRKIKTKEEGYKWLLTSHKPLFATPYTKELAERILELEKFEKDLRKKVGDKLVGLVVFGSTAKGYFQGSSDVDYAIIDQNYTVHQEFEKLKTSLDIRHWGYFVTLDQGKIKGEGSALFTGIFFGNRQKLLEYQKKFLEQADIEEWERVRTIVMRAETGLLKAGRRLNLSQKELEKVRQIVALTRTPPSLEKAREIINQRFLR